MGVGIPKMLSWQEAEKLCIICLNEVEGSRSPRPWGRKKTHWDAQQNGSPKMVTSR